MYPERNSETFSATLACGALILGLSAGSLGCTPPSVDPAPARAKIPDGPPARVDLPPMVKLEGSLPPETNADHTMRIDGLLVRREKFITERIRVKGYIVDTYVCPRNAKRCMPPHFYLADTPGEDRKTLMVVGSDEKAVKALKKNRPYLITGTFKTQSNEGFVRSAGLLLQEKIEEQPAPDAAK
ncbi:MAG: hypothetical protein VX589_10965 [Myxococcota bacterium]|nr:hypothetical protein [Myxococcota bacterium]